MRYLIIVLAVGSIGGYLLSEIFMSRYTVADDAWMSLPGMPYAEAE